MRILKFRGQYRFRTYHINITYKTQVELTARTIETAEAFGLGIDGEKTFVICDSDIDVNEGDIVYITGDSGSGKSSILREFKKVFSEQVADINDVPLITDKPLVDTVGKDVDEALKLLSFVGLNDAFLFLRKFPELSDGQKYRYKLAKLLESGKKVWVCDEFGSTLDRDTAKIVSWNMQKLARQQGITVLVATCNLDLGADLGPSVRIDKRYNSEIKITYAQNHPVKECTLLSEMYITDGTRKDWEILAPFHYRSHILPPSKKIFALYRGRGPEDKELCGVIVYSCPPLAVFGRKDFFGHGYTSNVKVLNEILTIISRVVVHPKYRSIGLGQKLVRESLPFAPTRYTETVAVMAKYNPFFEKAGMKKICVKKIERQIEKPLNYFKALGFDIRYLSSREYLRRFLTEHPEKLEQVKRIISNVHHIFLHKVLGSNSMLEAEFKARVLGADLETIVMLMSHLGTVAQPKVYLIHDKEWLKEAAKVAI